jgi:hypothetical protein
MSLNGQPQSGGYQLCLLRVRSLMFGRNKPFDPVSEVQDQLVARSLGVQRFADALDATLQRGLWRERVSASGEPFVNFGEFAVALQPNGLGVRSENAFLILRHPLLSAGYYHEFTQLLERVAREPGRPKINLSIKDDFPRFHQIPRSFTSTERMLIELKRKHAELFEEVCAHALTPRQAAIKAGFVAPCPTKESLSVEDITKSLNACEQIQVCGCFFRALTIEAQREFITLVLEPTLGAGLADRWRNQTSESA